MPINLNDCVKRDDGSYLCYDKERCVLIEFTFREVGPKEVRSDEMLALMKKVTEDK